VDPVFDCVSVAEDLAASDDPRLDRRYVRCVPASEGRQPVLLVGVVHDHPASVTRVSRVLELIEPETLAVELPPLAMPLFEQYADDPHRPPRLGGEMSAAIQGTDSPAIGIDAPTRSYFSRLVERVRAERPSRRVVGRLVRDLASAVGHALACRVASVVADYTPLRIRVYDPIVHSCSLVDTPHVQAADERAFLDRRDALFRAVRPPTSTRLIDGAREAAMSDLLDRARREGSVIAVVGMEHLDDVEADLRRAGADDELPSASDTGSK
jgi:pheromone shutdown protein TraB